MQLNIFDFLHKLETEGKILPRMREQVQEEIDKYEGMHQVLESGTTKSAFSENLLADMDRYLVDLRLVKQKLAFTFLTLVKSTPEEDPKLNRILLKLLQNLSKKDCGSINRLDQDTISFKPATLKKGSRIR
jgi:hypothetical protein